MSYLLILPLFLATFAQGTLESDLIRVTNHTDEPLYSAFYYKSGTTLSHAHTTEPLPPHTTITRALPPLQLFASRMLALSKSPEMPSHTHSSDASFCVPLQPIGLWESHDFTLDYNHTGCHMELFTTEQWRAEQHRRAQATQAAHIHPYAQEIATVETIQVAERDFYKQRATVVHTAQTDFFEHEITEPLHIGIAMSGGGMRAFFATLGLLCGLETINVLPMVTSCAALSGSTWAMLSWLMSNQPIHTYSEQLCDHLSHNILQHVSSHLSDYHQIKAEKLMYGASVNSIDFYGVFLSHLLLKPLHKNHISLRISDIANQVDPQKHPHLLCTAAARSDVSAPYSWLTLSPFSTQLLPDDNTIPTWALGRTFWHGSQTDVKPPLFLHYCMGIFGSSFSASIRDALDRAPDTLTQFTQKILPPTWHEQLLSSAWSNKKLVETTIPNFTFGKKAALHTHSATLSLFDGGYINNIPLEPLLQQSKPFDLIIILDSRRERDFRWQTVQSLLNTCRQAGYELPPLLEDDVKLHTLTAAASESQQTPSVLYLTLEPDDIFDAEFDATTDRTYATPNFFYTPDTARRLISFVTHVITHNKETIYQSLRDVLAKKSLSW